MSKYPWQKPCKQVSNPEGLITLKALGEYGLHLWTPHKFLVHGFSFGLVVSSNCKIQVYPEFTAKLLYAIFISPGYLGILYEDQGGLKLTDKLVSATQMLGLKAFAWFTLDLLDVSNQRGKTMQPFKKTTLASSLDSFRAGGVASVASTLKVRVST